MAHRDKQQTQIRGGWAEEKIHGVGFEARRLAKSLQLTTLQPRLRIAMVEKVLPIILLENPDLLRLMRRTYPTMPPSLKQLRPQIVAGLRKWVEK